MLSLIVFSALINQSQNPPEKTQTEPPVQEQKKPEEKKEAKPYPNQAAFQFQGFQGTFRTPTFLLVRSNAQLDQIALVANYPPRQNGGIHFAPTADFKNYFGILMAAGNSRSSLGYTVQQVTLKDDLMTIQVRQTLSSVAANEITNPFGIAFFSIPEEPKSFRIKIEEFGVDSNGRQGWIQRAELPFQ